MPRMTYINTEKEQIAFAETAARHFADNPEHFSFAIGELEPGAFLALRWGFGDDCVLVIKIDEGHTPINYQQLVRDFKKESDL